MHGGQALLRVVERAQIDTIVSSPGSEWPAVWEALAELAEQGGTRPRFVNCRHEALAVAVAAGYTKVTGRPQAVLLHATAGPLNAAMVLRAAYQERIPMVVCAGEVMSFGEDQRLPDPGGQWLHDLCDLGGPADLLLIQNMIRPSQPLSYFGRITGGLGVGVGYALGVKLALRQRPVFTLIGDGGFHYNPVPSCLGLAQEYDVPIAVVVFNNARYRSMERSLFKYFPQGAAKKTGTHYGSPIEPSPDYRRFAEAYGGYGIRVEKPEEVRPAIEQALAHLRRGRFALIDVALNDYTPR